MRVAAHRPLDSSKGKTRAVVKVTGPGFPFDLDDYDYGKIWNRCLHTANDGDGANWRERLKNFFLESCRLCLQGVQGLPNVSSMPAKNRTRHLVTVELGPMLWNRVEEMAQSQQRTRANVCRVIISQALNQCPTNTKILSRSAKP